MGKKKTKSDNQYLFIDFVNLNLTHAEQYSNLIERVSEIANVRKTNLNVDELKSELIQNSKVLVKLRREEKNYWEVFERRFILAAKAEFFEATDEEAHEYRKISEDTHKFIGTIPVSEKDVEELYKKVEGIIENPTLARVTDISEKIMHLLEFFYAVQYSQYHLMEILKEIIEGKKLPGYPIEVIERYYNTLKTRLLFGTDKYFKIEKTPATGTTQYLNPYNNKYSDFIKEIINPVIYYDLVEFLCTPKWKMLRQCPGVCGGKFFIKDGNMIYHSTECSKATKKKMDRESGSGKARQKKHRDKKKRERECRKKEQLKELRESAKSIA